MHKHVPVVCVRANTPAITEAELTPSMVVAMSWSDEGTDEALSNDRGYSGSSRSSDWEENFWSARE